MRIETLGVPFLHLNGPDQLIFFHPSRFDTAFFRHFLDLRHVHHIHSLSLQSLVLHQIEQNKVEYTATQEVCNLLIGI